MTPLPEAVQPVSDAPSCLHRRQCPINHAPCPGECVFAGIMESAALGILLFDVEARSVLFQNVEAQELFEGTAPPRDYEALARHLLTEIEFVSRNEPWSPPPLRLDSRLVGYTIYRNGRFVWMFLRDITEKARLEAVAEAVELTNSLGYVFATVRHEIGNPVNSVKTALSVLQANLHRFPPQTVREYVDRCLSELGRLESLLASLKSYSMYEDVRPREVELAPFLERVASLVAPEFARRGVALQVAVVPPVRAACFDPRALQQVLLNILKNAFDAVGERETPRVRVDVFRSTGAVAIAVCDNGRGMTEAEQARLFKPFSTSKEQGTGLGLVIAKKMLARMAGTIEIESQAGLGSTVTLTLPESCDSAA